MTYEKGYLKLGVRKYEINNDELLELRQSMTISDLANHYDCSKWTIKDRLKEVKEGKTDNKYNYYVYIVKNSINGKKYIGKRRCSCEIADDKYLGSGIILKKAIKKYGKENFTKGIIEVCETEDEAYDREIYWIAYYDATHSDEFYNISEGGAGVLGDVNTYGKPIVRINPKTSEVEKEFKSITEAHRDLGLFEYSNTLNIQIL